MSPIKKRRKLYKRFIHSGLETVKDNFKAAKILLHRMILKKNKSFFKEQVYEQTNRT